jgi:WD40 repeat protein
VSEDRKRIGLGTIDQLGVIDAATAKSVLEITRHQLRDSNAIDAFAFVPGSNLLAIGANRQLEEGKTGPKDGRLQVYDIALKHVVAVTDYMPWVNSVAASPNGDYLACGHFDSSIRIWDLRGVKAKMK